MRQADDDANGMLKRVVAEHTASLIRQLAGVEPDMVPASAVRVFQEEAMLAARVVDHWFTPAGECFSLATVSHEQLRAALATARISESRVDLTLQVELPDSVAVLPMRGKGGADARVLEVLDDLLLTSLGRIAGRGLRVIGKSDIDAMLGFEKTKDLLGCDDVSCTAEMAGALGVDSVLAPTLGVLDDKYILTLAWISQRNAEVLRRHSESLGSSVATFDQGIAAAVARLLGVEPTPSRPEAADPTRLSGRWVGNGINTWSDCGGVQGSRVPLVITLSVSAAGDIRGTFAFADGGPTNLHGRLQGDRLRVDYMGKNFAEATVSGRTLRGSYTHFNASCPSWGGSIEATQE